jgi:hypothetical protein
MLNFAMMNRTGIINGSVTQTRNIAMRLSSCPKISEIIILAIIANETTFNITAMRLAKKCKKTSTLKILSE